MWKRSMDVPSFLACDTGGRTVQWAENSFAARLLVEMPKLLMHVSGLIAPPYLRTGSVPNWPFTCSILWMMLLSEEKCNPRYQGRKLRPPTAAILVLAWVALFQAACLFQAASRSTEPVAVRQTEGQVHGFLVLSTLAGASIADGDSTQVTHGDEVTSQSSYHFKDGSLQEETAVFTQHGHFHLVSDHLVQKGPVFRQPMDVSIDGSTGVVTVRYHDEKGKDKTETARLALPPDLSNGIISILLKNLPPGSQATTLSMVVATPKPLLIKLAISAAGADSFLIGETSYKATRYVIKAEIGGVRGVLAHLVGKQPPDTLVWILPGSCPTYLKSEGQSFEGGPIWVTQLVSPAWPRTAATAAGRGK